MPSAAYYRTEANRCRQLANSAQESALATRWRGIAREYDLLADAMDEQSYVARPVEKPQVQQMQQGKLDQDE